MVASGHPGDPVLPGSSCGIRGKLTFLCFYIYKKRVILPALSALQFQIKTCSWNLFVNHKLIHSRCFIMTIYPFADLVTHWAVLIILQGDPTVLCGTRPKNDSFHARPNPSRSHYLGSSLCSQESCLTP